MNNTHKAIDLIPKDVVISDWHYTRAVPTAPYFAAKGFRVVSCPWRIAEVGRQQVDQMVLFRRQSTPEMRDRFAGVMQTVWSDAKTFMDLFYGRIPSEGERGGDVETFKAVFDRIAEHGTNRLQD